MRLKIKYFLFVSLIFFASCQMRSKTFTSKDGWYKLTLPANWEEYDDKDDSTHAFFNSKSWTGNLRITTLHWENRANEDKTGEMILEEVQENAGATLMKMGEFDCAHYKTITEDSGEEMVMYYWTFGKNNNLFVCSFTTDRKYEQNTKIKKEVEGIIRSIRTN
jgi:hypothetical protein